MGLTSHARRKCIDCIMWHHLRGHHRLIELFRRAIRRGRGAHAYLLTGPEGIGKRLFARTVAQCLFCQRVPDEDLDACGECPSCRQMQAGTHPDLLEVGCPEGKRELPISLIAGSDERRGKEGLCYELAMKPMTAGRRIAIIDDAQTMNDASANALLKTLEEPPPGSILFLLTPSVDAILPTIRSRCQPVMFAPLSDTDVADLLVELGWVSDASVAAETAALCEGSLATAQQLLRPELRQLRQSLLRALARTPMQSLPVTADVQAALEELGGDTATQRRYAGWVTRFCVEYLRSRLRDVEQTTPDDVDRLSAQVERCLDAEGHLAQSMPVPLCLEGLFDDLARIGRGAVTV
jgi:DNA polymerase III subunit delta'